MKNVLPKTSKSIFRFNLKNVKPYKCVGTETYKRSENLINRLLFDFLRDKNFETTYFVGTSTCIVSAELQRNGLSS